MVATAACGRGAFIVFEGVDRSGKSTQSKRLVDNLKASGVDAELWCFPDRSLATGQMIDSYLKSKSELDDAAVHLLFSANRWEKRAHMMSKLRAGTTLIVDRYAFSGAIFTAAKQLPGLDLDWAKAADRGLPAPDAVLYLDLTVEAAAQRGGYGNERYEKQEMQREVCKLYSVLQQQVPGWRMLDAARPVEELSQEIMELALKLVQDCAKDQECMSLLWTGKAPNGTENGNK